MEKIKSLKGQRPITALTAYDYAMAGIVSKAGVDMILVGDSLGMVVLGYENTHFVTLDDMIRCTQAVLRANQEALVVTDMPFGTCDTIKMALKNCGRMIEETGVRAVKIEGKADIVAEVVKSGIAVLGHAGLKPQEVDFFSVQGRDADSARVIMAEAKSLEAAGAFAIILECISEQLGKEITEELKIPTIGIGAGRYTDGQILVLNDMLGLYRERRPRFVRQYADLAKVVTEAVKRYKDDVIRRDYPNEGEVYGVR